MNVQARLFKKKKEKKERKKKKMQNKPQRESKENSIAAIANIVLAATLCEDIRNDFFGGTLAAVTVQTHHTSGHWVKLIHSKHLEDRQLQHVCEKRRHFQLKTTYYRPLQHTPFICICR